MLTMCFFCDTIKQMGGVFMAAANINVRTDAAIKAQS